MKVLLAEENLKNTTIRILQGPFTALERAKE
jgi:hypothetical protein